MPINTPIESLPHTSSLTIKRLKSLEINSYWDLLNYFPYRYENYSLISPISRLQPEEIVTVKGTLLKIQNIYTRSGLRIQKALMTDGTGSLRLIWFNQPYLLRLFKKDQFVSVSGKVENEFGKLLIKPLEYELLPSMNSQTLHTGRLIPIYSEKGGPSSKTIREKIYSLLPSHPRSYKDGNYIEEILPDKIISYNGLINEQTAYHDIHFPESLIKAKKAQERLAFDELFIIGLSTDLVKNEWQREKVGSQLSFDKKNQKLLSDLVNSLPFKLTTSQNKVGQEIISDLQKTQPMNRLLQGEVGSGKTVVAALAAHLAQLNHCQTLFMAPTEILAQQHFETLQKTLSIAKVKIILVTGSIKPNKKDFDQADIIVGTQALIQKKINFQRIGLVVIDEQHRFGVRQRALLKEKAVNPHLLTMTATPIPRTVALTLYGELDLSTIDEMPQGRLPVKTFLVPKAKRPSAYDWIKKQISENKSQVFIICPFIEESAIETMKSVKAATKEYQYLKEKVFASFRLALLHGKMKSKEKNQVMADFKNKTYDILVATSVVEVGIDVPSATIIIIEGAERYGLAQLHQLRGRVGRRNKQSYCLLFSEVVSLPIQKRLNIFAKENNGNKLAEYDLELRGPGNIYGITQHGQVDLKIASLTNYSLIKKSKSAAAYFIAHHKLSDFINLKSRLDQYRLLQISRD